MNEDAGNGGTRLDAAKQAVDALVDRLPAGAPLGLRVYGSKVSEVSRAEGCQDTELTVPVGPLDKDALRDTVNALAGQGPDADRALAARGARTTSAPRRAGAASSWSPTAATTARRRTPARRPRRWPSAASRCRSRSSASRSMTACASSCAASPRRAAGPTSTSRTPTSSATSCRRCSRARSGPTSRPGPRSTGGPTPEQAPALGQGLFLDTSRQGRRRALVHGRRPRGPAAGRLGARRSRRRARVARALRPATSVPAGRGHSDFTRPSRTC